MKFTEGEEVLAKHPSTSEYYRGRILNVRGDRYKIKFETGVEHTINENNIKYERQARTPSRSSSRITRKSPSRQSPSRRSPSRRSPARSPTTTSRKLPIRSTRLAKISLPRIDAQSDKISNHKQGTEAKILNENVTEETIPLQRRLKEISTVTRRSARLLSIKTEHQPLILTRNIDRAVSLPVEKKSYLHDYPLEEKERGYSMQRDQDLIKSFIQQESEKSDTPIALEREKEINRVSEPQEWGGWIGTCVFIFVMPLSIILPQLLCSKEQCRCVRLQFFTKLESYINLHGFLSYVVFLTLLACISIVPIGKVVVGQQSKTGRLHYRVNGFLNVIVVMAMIGLCLYKNVAVADYILDNIIQLSVSGWIIATMLSLALYIKAGKAPVANLNIYASTKSKIYNFWQGREINPRIGSLDIKLVLMRASVIGALIVNIAIAIKAIGNTKSLNIEQFDITALLAVSLQLFYIIDRLIYESITFTSFAIMYEGTGYMTCVTYLLYPFLSTLTTRFILYQKIKFNYFTGIFVLSFMTGYSLYRKSNSQKDEFRKNPVSPTVPFLETIPTSRGKKLMVSGLWGYVKHPNYLGDIIMQWSIASISLMNDFLPYYLPIWYTLMLSYRAVRDNRRCETRYGYAWEQYCSRVKYMILKRIF